jgi:hypothetical protein
MIEWLLENLWLVYMSIGIVGVKIGWSLHEAWMIWLIREHPERMEMAINLSKRVNQMNEQQLDDLADQLKQARDAQDLVVKPAGTEMTIERVGNMLYAYAKDTGQFLAQGPNLDAVIKNTELRYPGQKFFGTIANDNSAKELAQ